MSLSEHSCKLTQTKIRGNIVGDSCSHYQDWYLHTTIFLEAENRPKHLIENMSLTLPTKTAIM